MAPAGLRSRGAVLAAAVVLVLAPAGALAASDVDLQAAKALAGLPRQLRGGAAATTTTTTAAANASAGGWSLGSAVDASAGGSCCGGCSGGYCSPVSGRCYLNKDKDYYQTCGASGSCCGGCNGGYCSPVSGRCYLHWDKDYYQNCN